MRHGLVKFELGELLESVVDRTMKAERLNYGSYVLPLLFFMFIYFAGFLIALPEINCLFAGCQGTTLIPLFSSYKSIPFIVIEWGFFGGLVYTSIDLLNRFLRKDIVPKVYFNASFRLIFAVVVALVIYFIYMIAHSGNIKDTLPQILLVSFLAGVAPVRS